jgi:hypothetical protein
VAGYHRTDAKLYILYIYASMVVLVAPGNESTPSWSIRMSTGDRIPQDGFQTVYGRIYLYLLMVYVIYVLVGSSMVVLVALGNESGS